MNELLHERKWELDSIAAFFKLSSAVHAHLPNSVAFSGNFPNAIQSALKVLVEQQSSTTQSTNGATKAQYTFQRETSQPTDTLQFGIGNPRRFTGIYIQFKYSNFKFIIFFRK